MKKIIFVWVLSLILLSSFSISAQTVSKDTSQITKENLTQHEKDDILKEIEKLRDDNNEKAIEGANRSILISTLVVIFVTLIAIVVGIFGFFRIREIRADYKESKAELRRSFEEDLEKVRKIRKDIEEICESIKEKRKFVDEETENFKKRIKAQQEGIPPDFSREASELVKKDSKTAIEDYEKIMNKIFDEGTYLRMAYNYYVEKKYDESILELKKALKLNPDSCDAYHNWGLNLGELGRHKEALEKYKKATELEPNYAAAYNNWGWSLNEIGRYKEAIDELNKAIKLAPNRPEPYSHKGLALGKLGKYEEAIKSCEKAIKLKPSYAQAFHNMARIYSLQDMKKETLENLKRAIELNPALKEQAKKDKDFKNLWKDEDFKRLVG